MLPKLTWHTAFGCYVLYVCVHMWVFAGTVQPSPSEESLLCWWVKVWSVPWCFTALPPHCFKEVLAYLTASVIAAQWVPKLLFCSPIRASMQCWQQDGLCCVYILAVTVMKSCQTQLLLWAVMFVYRMYSWVVEHSGKNTLQITYISSVWLKLSCPCGLRFWNLAKI